MFIDEDEAVADRELYACEACPVADMLAELDDDPENFEAWSLFHRSVSRFTVDTHLTGIMVGRELAERDKEDAYTLLERLTMLYDILHPPPESK